MIYIPLRMNQVEVIRLGIIPSHPHVEVGYHKAWQMAWILSGRITGKRLESPEDRLEKNFPHNNPTILNPGLVLDLGIHKDVI